MPHSRQRKRDGDEEEDEEYTTEKESVILFCSEATDRIVAVGGFCMVICELQKLGLDGSDGERERERAGLASCQFTIFSLFCWLCCGKKNVLK